ncbi:MAG: ABC transporter permease [Armatimonadota bacterium]|nr:ABC transporter permease [Armatimonadota bacterium]MDR7562960.1 ABC transporter permease [Armatimonadota bacterium]MDR7567793.1 ABC transporter permease [Armatimonadota bacterium]MDR7603055.1 ABC transporter permease [Armatimonadota bacterium]
MVCVVMGLSLLAPWLTPHDPAAVDPPNALQPPSPRHPLGTDRLGRDVLSRVLQGGRISLMAGGAAVVAGAGIGVPLGLACGYWGGRLDFLGMRVVDGLMTFPALLLALLVISAFGPGPLQATAAVGAVLIPGFARLSRGLTLVVRTQEFVLAARALGSSDGSILRTHILPHVTGPLLVQLTAALSGAVLAEASLSYLGLGAQPPTPSWGGMLQEARDVLFVAPWMAIGPGVALFLSVLGWNLVGDGLRDLLDPYRRRRPAL